MRIKKFTLMTLALLVSMVSFAQKSGTERSYLPLNRHVERQIVPSAPVNGSFLQTTTPTKPVVTFKAEQVVPPEGSEPEYATLTGTYYTYGSTGWSDPIPVERTVQVIQDGDDVYISSICYYTKAPGYVKGTYTEGNTLVFKTGQYFGNAGADIFFGGWDEDDGEIDATVTFNGEENSFTFNCTIGMFSATGGRYGYIEDLKVTITDDIDLPIEPPTDLVTEKWAYTGLNYWHADQEVSKTLNIGFYGNDVYIQGLCDKLPEAWVKGTMDGELITFPGYQYYGQSGNYKFYMRGLTGDSFGDGDVIFTYDATTNTLTTDQAIFLYGESPSGGGNYAAETNVVIKKIVEKPATPATPTINTFGFYSSFETVEFDVPVVDTEKEGLIAEKLSYQLFYKDELGTETPIVFTKDLYTKLTEDMSVIPYGFTDDYDIFQGEISLNMDWSKWTEIGIKSIYTGGDETHESPISWLAIERPTTATLPKGLKITTNAFVGTKYSSSSSVPFTKTLNVAVDGNDLYIQGLSQDTNTGEAWIKGTKEGDVYVFKRGQALGGGYFLIGYNDETSTAEDAKLTVDTESGVYKFANEFIVNAYYIDHLYYSGWFESGSTIAITGESEEPTTAPASLETKDAFMAGYLNTGSAKVTLQNVKMGKVDNDIYIQGVYAGMPEGWVKGTLNTETNIVTFEPQLIGMEEDYTKHYFVGTTSGKDATTLQFSYKTTQKGETLLELVKPNFYSISPSKTAGSVAYYGYNLVFHDMQATETVPAGLTATDYLLNYDKAKVNNDNSRTYTPISHNIKFGILDNKAYLKGLSADAPEAWIVGNVDGNKITFETPQALTSDGEIIMLSWDITSSSFLLNVELTWNAETKELTSVADNEIMVNSELVNRSYTYERMAHLSAKEIADVAATPAKPKFENLHFTPSGFYIGFDINTVDTEGEGLLTDKLSYKFYSKGETGEPQEVTFTTELYKKLTNDMTEIPYGFVDAEGGYDFGTDFVYLNMDISAWKEIGLQAIYKGGNATNASEIAWYTVVYPYNVSLPSGVEPTTHAFTGTQGSAGTPFSKTVKLAKVDNDLYIQGLYEEAWIKGSLTAENTYTFGNGQLLGVYGTKYMLFLLGTDALTAPINVVNPVIVYNATNNQYELVTNFLVNATYTDRSYFLDRFNIGSVINATPTGIDTVKADTKFNADAPAYNMAGQRVNNSFKGMIIKDGQKFMNK
jgi:hypothetical protein